MVCPGGVFIVNLMDRVLSGHASLIVCLAELLVVAYVYGESP